MPDATASRTRPHHRHRHHATAPPHHTRATPSTTHPSHHRSRTRGGKPPAPRSRRARRRCLTRSCAPSYAGTIWPRRASPSGIRT